MEPVRMTLMLEKIRKTGEEMSFRIYTEVARLKAVCAVTPEPVPFPERGTLEYRPIEVGDVWSDRLWDCAWFHLTGEAPRDIADEDLCLGIDIDGEGCLFADDGTPVRGLTNVSSEFDRSLGFPGKCYVPFTEGTFRTRPVDVWMEAGNNDLFGRFRGGKVVKLGIYRCNRALRDLYYDYKFLTNLAEGLPERDPLKMGIYYALEKVGVNLPVRATDEQIARFRGMLRPWLERKGAPDPALTFYAVGHSHLDLAWLWPLRETRRKAGRTFSTALANLKAYPDYIFGASQPQQFEWVKKDYPALFERLRAAVSAGRIEPQGGMWVEADTNLTGGESLIRQFYYGKKFWREEFGKDTDILWLPDVFGFSGTLPQIMRGCGCENFLTIKLSWNKVNKFPYHSFRWKGIDGSEVLVHMPPEGTYNSSGSPKAVFAAAGEYSERGLSENAMMLYGIGDGGGGPGREHLEYLKREGDICGLPRVKNATAGEFFAALQKEKEVLPEYRGEIYLERHQGTYTSQAANKRFNRLAEEALAETEFVYALTGEKDCGKLDGIWKEVLLYQFHDILPGSAIRRVYDETKPRYEAILCELNHETESRLIKENGKLCALNPTGFFRREYVRRDGRWYEVNAKPFALSEAEETKKQGGCKAEGLTLENSLISAQFDKTGMLVSLFDKKAGRKAVSCGNMLRVYEDMFDAWDTYAGYVGSAAESPVLTEVETVNEGLRAELVLKYRYGGSLIEQRVSVTEDSALLRFDNRVDWQETAKMLRVDFKPEIYADEVTCDIQFGNLKRSMTENNSHEWAQYEVCAHKWIDMSERGYGVALLNDCKYGYRAKNGVISMNLLRSQIYPCSDQDKGENLFTFALLPHEGDVYAGGVAREAYALNRPLRFLKSGATDSLVYSDHEHAVIETVKPAYDGNGVIARVYNDMPEKISARLFGKFTDIRITDMLENDCGAAEETIGFAPYEIKTLRLL